MKAVFDLYLDEHGTIGSATDDNGYGYGYLVIERGPLSDFVSQAVAKAFPDGAHFKNFRGKKRKKSNAEKMMECIPEHGRMFGGAFACVDPDYGRNHYFNALSGIIGDSDTPSKNVLAEIMSTQPRDGRLLIDPSDVSPGAKEVGRLLATYSHLLRIPVLGLLKLVPDEELELHVHLGVVGSPTKYDEQMRKIGPVLASNWESSFEKFQHAGLDRELPCRLILGTVEAGADPLFDVADLMAHLGFHASRDDVADDETTAGALYGATKRLLDKVPWTPDKVKIATGVTRYPPEGGDLS